MQDQKERQRCVCCFIFTGAQNSTTADTVDTVYCCFSQVFEMSESLDHVFKILLIGDAGVGKSR